MNMNFFLSFFLPEDTSCDLNFDTTGSQAIVWAVGGVGATAFKHYRRAERKEKIISRKHELGHGCARLHNALASCVTVTTLKCLKLMLQGWCMGWLF